MWIVVLPCGYCLFLVSPQSFRGFLLLVRLLAMGTMLMREILLQMVVPSENYVDLYH